MTSPATHADSRAARGAATTRSARLAATSLRPEGGLATHHTTASPPPPPVLCASHLPGQPGRPGTRREGRERRTRRPPAEEMVLRNESAGQSAYSRIACVETKTTSFFFMLISSYVIRILSTAESYRV
jgi:hypothetical protein